MDLLGAENVSEATKFLGVLRTAATYPAMNLALKVLKIVVPSFEAKRIDHLEFTKAKIEKRLDMRTNRSDFMTYASSIPICLVVILPNQPIRSSGTTTNVE
ncbi:MAG: hypothetical protein Q9166_004952 [cf. Caloplaca sp. 2 TL-2023]